MATVTGLTSYIGGRYHGAQGNVLSRTGVDSAVHAARRVPARPRTRVTTKLDYSCSMCRKCTVSGGGIRGPWQVWWMAWPARRVSLTRPTRQGVARTRNGFVLDIPQFAVPTVKSRQVLPILSCGLNRDAANIAVVEREVTAKRALISLGT